MRALLFVATLAVFFAAPEALAAGEGGGEAHGPDWFLLGLQVFNIGLLGFVLFRFARKPLMDFLQQRSDGIRDQIEAAKRDLEGAQQEVAQLRERLGRIESEKAAFVAEAEQNAKAEAERHIERANQASVRIQEDARRVANQEIARARSELQSEAATLATTLAGELLREQLTPDDDKRIVSEFIDRAGSES